MQDALLGWREYGGVAATFTIFGGGGAGINLAGGGDGNLIQILWSILHIENKIFYFQLPGLSRVLLLEL